MIPDDFADTTTQSRRLAILRVLRENEGAANESLLRVSLHQLGFRGLLATEEAIRDDGRWLAERHLVTVELYKDRVITLAVTDRGLAFLRRGIPPISGIQFPDEASTA